MKQCIALTSDPGEVCGKLLARRWEAAPLTCFGRRGQSKRKKRAYLPAIFEFLSSSIYLICMMAFAPRNRGAFVDSWHCFVGCGNGNHEMTMPILE